MIMPRGIFKGREIESIPSDYLLWIAENWNENTPEDKTICVEADEEWQHREKNNEHREE